MFLRLFLLPSPVPKLSPLNLVILSPDPYLSLFPKVQNVVKLNSDKYKVLYFGLKNQHTSITQERCGSAKVSGLWKLLKANNDLPRFERILVASATVRWWRQHSWPLLPLWYESINFTMGYQGICKLISIHIQTKCFPEELQSESISFLKDSAGVSLSYTFVIQWLDRS